MRALITLTVCLLAAMSAWAASTDLKPSQIFAADSPSIVVVVAYGSDGKAIAQGSGVVIAKDTVVSNCHVIEKADTASVLYQNKRLAVTLRYADFERDLCSFTVKGLSAPPVQMGFTSEEQVGDAAYAIGAPEGLDLTLSGGLISSLRKIPGGTVLQMTTPISPGSSGGGLFDAQGRLIGITSYYIAKGEQLNFALPVEWVRELPQHGKLASTNTKRVAHIGIATQKFSVQDGVRALAGGDYATAFAILKPLAMQGNADAQGYLGSMYENGWGVRQGYTKALAWYRKAAGQGNAFAQDMLGGMYASGVGAPQDYTQAVAWYFKAAAQGNAGAQNNLGLMYANGQGVAQDYAQAVVWYRKAAAQGYAEAQSNLGVEYANGLGVPQDYAVAAVWFLKAAKQGDAIATLDLGVMYDNGQGVPQDHTQAAVWFRKAAEQGNAVAQYELGLDYYLGQGVSQDFAQALVWYGKAADQGEPLALSNLGVMYAFGFGVPQNYVVAYALFNLSATLDSTDKNKAINDRTKIVNRMTTSQVEAGQALTREMQRIGVIKALDKYLNGGAS